MKYVPAWRGASCSPSKIAAYQGLRKPACHGGRGCFGCCKVYNSRDAAKLRLRKAYGGRYADVHFKGAFIAARIGETTLRQSKAAINRTWQTFLHQGTTHSARAETLLDIINRCEREGVPYNLKAYPGHGYSIIALPPLPKEKIHA